MNLLKIHLAVFVIMLSLIVFFLGLSKNAPSSTLVSTEKKTELNVTGKSLQNYSGATFSIGSASAKCSMLY